MWVTWDKCIALGGALLAGTGAAIGGTVSLNADDMRQAHMVAEIIIEANISDEDVPVIARCVVERADKMVVSALISAASNGVEQSHVDAVVEIAYLAETMACVRKDALI